MAVNKDTDDVYCEWVHFDKERFDQLIARAQRLISSTTAPFRMSTDPEFFECKWCSMWKHCHGGQAAEANCRTCVRATPVAKGAWQCGIYKRELALNEQRSGCGDHLMIPDLVPYGDPQDGGENWIAYKHKETGDMFVNGLESNNDYGPVFSSRELHQTNGSLIGDIIKLKLEFPVSKVAAGSTTSPWDDLATHPDDLPVKPDAPEQRKEAKKIKSAVKALEAFK
jgi:hypothetical protein